MHDYYEQLWERLPKALKPPELQARRRLLLSELSRGERVLDLGCGEGLFCVVAARAGAGQVVGADVAEAALQRAREAAEAAGVSPEITLIKVPFDGPLPLPDNSFELVWASEVIEHVADTAAWLSEVRRVLTPGGRLLITTPAHGRLRLLVGGVERYSDPQGDHLHLYTARSLRTLLSEFGFADFSVGALSGPPLYRRTLLARAAR